MLGTQTRGDAGPACPGSLSGQAAQKSLFNKQPAFLDPRRNPGRCRLASPPRGCCPAPRPGLRWLAVASGSALLGKTASFTNIWTVELLSSLCLAWASEGSLPVRDRDRVTGGERGGLCLSQHFPHGNCTPGPKRSRASGGLVPRGGGWPGNRLTEQGAPWLNPRRDLGPSPRHLDSGLRLLFPMTPLWLSLLPSGSGPSWSTAAWKAGDLGTRL